MNHASSVLGAISLLLMSAFAAGCNDYATPHGVANIAGKAVRDNDLRLLRSVLLGAAETQYANRQGLVELREKLRHVENLRLAGFQRESKLRRACAFGCERTDYYSFDVVGDERYLRALVKGVTLFSARALCDVTYNTRCKPRGNCYTYESRRCWITDLD